MSHTISNNQRIEYIDALRGFAMLLVVFGHIHLRGYEMVSGSSFVISMIAICNMPLFFFLSGFVSFKERTEWPLRDTLHLAVKKICHLLIPFIIFCVFMAALAHDRIINILADPMKHGYWFLPVLCWSYLVYYGLCWLMDRARMPRRYKDIFLIAIAVVIFLWGSVLKKYSDGPSYFSGVLFTRYFHFFICGLLARKYIKYFMKLFEEWSFFLLFLLGFFLTILMWDSLSVTASNVLSGSLTLFRVISVFITYVPLPYIYLLIIFGVFYKSYDSIKNRGGKYMSFIGKRTLDIYMLHYFFIPVLPFCIENPNGLLYILGTFCMTLIVVIISLFVGAVLRTSNILAFLLFGQKLSGAKSESKA